MRYLQVPLNYVIVGLSDVHVDKFNKLCAVHLTNHVHPGMSLVVQLDSIQNLS